MAARYCFAARGDSARALRSLPFADERAQKVKVLLVDEGSTDDRGAGPQEQLCGRHLIADGLTPAVRPRRRVDSVSR